MWSRSPSGSLNVTFSQPWREKTSFPAERFLDLFGDFLCWSRRRFTLPLLCSLTDGGKIVTRVPEMETWEEKKELCVPKVLRTYTPSPVFSSASFMDTFL